MTTVGDLISRIFNCPVHTLSARADSDSLSAECLVDGHYCTVLVEGDRLVMERNDSVTAHIQGHAAGVADSVGIRLNSDNPYEELAGYLRLDVKCSGGNKPCGKTCIPQRYQCKVKGGGALKSGGGEGFSPPESQPDNDPPKKKGGGNAGKIAAGVAAGALGVGALGATGAYLALNRKEMKEKYEAKGEKAAQDFIKNTKRGADAVKQRVKKKVGGKREKQKQE